MPNWYWEKKELRMTPSQAPQGPNTAGTTAGPANSASSAANSTSSSPRLDFDTEMRYRREGARFIIELGKKLNLSHNTMATGAVYFHRFYMFHSFMDFPKYVSQIPKICFWLLLTILLYFWTRWYQRAASFWPARLRRRLRSAGT